MQAFGGDFTHPGTYLQTGRQPGVGTALCTWLAYVLVHQVFKYRSRPLEAIGADVGQVVGNHVHLPLLGFQAGFGRPQ